MIAAPAAIGVGPVEEAKFFLDGQPIDAAAMFRGCPQPGALPGGFEDGFALRVVDAFTHEDGGDGGGDAFDRGHDPVCFNVSGVQTCGFRMPMRAKIAGDRRAGSVSSFPLRFVVESSPAGDQERRLVMRVKVFLEITAEDGSAGGAAEVAVFEKQTERPEDLGLSIAEGKALTAAIQQQLVDAQVATWAERHRCCEACGARRHSKGSHPVIFMTLYGDVGISSPRLHRCPCQGTGGPATMSPLRDLIPDHVAPERLYLEARWSSLVPYAAAAGLLADVLPIASGANATTLREHTLRVAERAEAELGGGAALFH